MKELHIFNSLLYLIVFCFAQYSVARKDKNRTDVLVNSENQCADGVINMDPDRDYKVNFSLLNSSCSTNPHKKGFSCKLIFIQPDSFAYIGSQLCVDIQGIAETMTNTQLLITVYNQRQQMLKDIYATNRFYPLNDPYYVCSNESQGSLAIGMSVRDSVWMCPHIMDSLVGQNINLGVVTMKPTLPTYQLSMKDCGTYISTIEDAYIVKVDATGRDFCDLKIWMQHYSYTNTNSCIQLMYVSNDFRCNFEVSLLYEHSEPIISFNVSQKNDFLRQQLYCTSYSSADVDSSQKPLLLIHKYDTRRCLGSIILKATFTRSPFQEVEGDSQADHLRLLYMAVFISLIAACLLILAVTCICCLRMRSKRLRSQEHVRGTAGSNQGYDASLTDFNSQAVSRRTSNPDEIMGLPTYDEIYGPDGSNTQYGQNSTLDQKPPDYDSLFTSNA